MRTSTLSRCRAVVRLAKPSAVSWPVVSTRCSPTSRTSSPVPLGQVRGSLQQGGLVLAAAPVPPRADENVMSLSSVPSTAAGIFRR